MPDPALTLSRVSFRYLSRSDWALDEVTFDVLENEFLGVTGPSGAGKSTLCLTLNGLVPHVIEGAMRGLVRVRSVDTLESNVSELSSMVGLVLQDPRSQLTGSAMTVEEEVAFGLQNLGVPREVMRERIREALEAVGLAGLEQRSPFELSGGEQQRLSLATVLAMRPQILVLDEPTEMLDPEGTFTVMEAIHSIHVRYRMTTVFVSNQPELLVKYANRILVLNKGRVVSMDTPVTFSKKARLLESIGVRPTQVSQLFARLDEKGLTFDHYPADEIEAAGIIEKTISR